MSYTKHYSTYKSSKVNLDDLTLDKRIDQLILLKSAYWHYLDRRHLREHNYPFKLYLHRVIQYKPDHIKIWMRELNKYNKSIPTAGAIIYSNQPDGVYLLTVRNDNAKVLSMPKGKQESGELLYNTAIREVLEETGMDLSSMIHKDSTYCKIKKCRFYKVEYDSLVDCSKHETREIQEVSWVKARHIFEQPKLYSNQVISVARTLLAFPS